MIACLDQLVGAFKHERRERRKSRTLDASDMEEGADDDGEMTGVTEEVPAADDAVQLEEGEANAVIEDGGPPRPDSPSPGPAQADAPSCPAPVPAPVVGVFSSATYDTARSRRTTIMQQLKQHVSRAHIPYYVSINGNALSELGPSALLPTVMERAQPKSDLPCLLAGADNDLFSNRSRKEIKLDEFQHLSFVTRGMPLLLTTPATAENAEQLVAGKDPIQYVDAMTTLAKVLSQEVQSTEVYRGSNAPMSLRYWRNEVRHTPAHLLRGRFGGDCDAVLI
jgi:hypothetical protein